MARLRRRWWWFWHPYSDWSVKRRGKRDGSQTPPIPPWETEQQAPFLMQLKQAGDNDVRILARVWSRLDQKLKAAWLHAKRALAQTERQHNSAEQAYREACRHYEEVHKKPPPASADRRAIAYWFLISLLFICEFPMNAIVFRLFRENEIFTYVATAAIALALLACAHQLGVLVQERAVYNKKNTVGIIALIVIPVLVIASVAYLREEYLKRAGGGPNDMNATAMWLTFAAFNLIIFVVAAIASYRVHDEALVRLHSAARLRRAGERAHADSETWLVQARTDREKQFDSYRAAAHLIKDTVQRLVAVYHTSNLENRGDREKNPNSPFPKSFGNYPEVTIPEQLETLEWEDSDAIAQPDVPELAAAAPGGTAPNETAQISSGLASAAGGDDSVDRRM